MASNESHAVRSVAICKQSFVHLITNALQVADCATKNGCRGKQTAVLCTKRAQMRAQIIGLFADNFDRNRLLLAVVELEGHVDGFAGGQVSPCRSVHHQVLAARRKSCLSVGRY